MAPDSQADILLHPVRMRLVQLLASGPPATAQQLAEALPDVPPATLYRHLNKLVEAGLLEVASERRVRGAIEKAYRLVSGAGHLGPEALAESGPADHLRYFNTFLATLMGGFARYLDTPGADPAQDGVGYHTIPIYASDEELMALSQQMSALLAPLASQGPAPGRRLRMLSTVLMPATDIPPKE